MPQVLVFGRNEGAPYHPLAPLQEELVALFGGPEVAASTDQLWQLRDLAKAGVTTLAALDDNWDEPLDLGTLFAVERWIRKGGHLLLVHNGICWARHRRWKALVGAGFEGHGPARLLEFVRNDGSRFELFEEPYRFTFARGRRKVVLATYRDEGKEWPAAWTCTCGLGSITYALPGHFPAAFQEPVYRNWLRDWAGHRASVVGST